MSSFRDRTPRVVAALLALVASASGGQPPAPEAASPEEVIRRSNEEILELYRSREETDADLQRDVFAVMDRVTDFDRLAGAALDGPCEPFPAEQCAELESTFVELLRAAAVRRLGRYRADRFEYLGESVDGDRAEVRTTALYGENAVPLVYTLERIDGAWRIVDYEVSEVPTVDSYRRQFARLLGRQSVESVIGRLERRIERFRADAAGR